jgi:hypothetical protein
MEGLIIRIECVMKYLRRTEKKKTSKSGDHSCPKLSMLPVADVHPLVKKKKKPSRRILILLASTPLLAIR